MKTLLKISLIGVFAVLLSSCNDPKETDCIYLDKRLCDPNFVPPEIEDGIVDLDTDLSNYDEKVLLEDFTGFRCSNCPPATVTAVNIKASYPERVSIVGVHCTNFFAAPSSSDPNEPFSTDFRTTEGEEFVDYYGLPSLPNGVINRLGNEFNDYIPFTQWTDRVNSLMTENNPEVLIDIRSIEVDEKNGLIIAKVHAKPLISSSETYILNMSVTEDGIPEGQYDNDVDGGIVYDYTHNHVFRGSAYGSWGLDVFDGDIVLGSNEVIAYTLTMEIDPIWVLENCEILVFISKSSNREVVQVEETHLID